VTRIVHTADWHLGARLIDCDRHEEHRAFLDWLLVQLEELRPDLLIVAGDIFDGATPPQEALTLYYRFLSRLATGARCQTLILGGNHDSPATLHAPREVLRALDVRVIASPPDDPTDGLLEFEHVIVGAMPFLRERDVRLATPGQTADDVATAIRQGVAERYRAMYAFARSKAADRLIIATGHLTAVGSQSSPSERIIHIGNLGSVSTACFEGFAYTALGHIHRPQAIGGDDRVRYAGSPLPLSFAEVDLAKEIRVIDVEGNQLAHRAISIPIFRRVLRLTTATADLMTELARHQATSSEPLWPWVELTVNDGRSHPDLDRQVRDAARELRLRVLKVLTPALLPLGDANHPTSSATAPSLDDLRPEDVFLERLRREQIDPTSGEACDLVATFAELLSKMHETVPAEITESTA